VFIVSAFRLEKIEEAEDDAHKGEYVPGIRVKINRAPGEKCERCWMYSETVGTIEGRHDVCERCANVLEEIGM
jgi:isoleucyl-tRNA synthetase